MKKAGLLGLLLVMASVALAEGKKSGFDAAALVGSWTYVTGTKAGEKVPALNLEGEVKFTKDTITVPSGQPNKPFLMGYTIKEGTTPTAIDLVIKDGPIKEGKAEGIISQEGDGFKLCYVVVGTGKRPEKFESTKENQAFLFTLKKAKK